MQKTAYEMRISDWISDVCSSDLDRHVDLARDGFDFMLALGETRKEGATTCLSVNLPVALAAAPTYLARQGHPRSPADLGGAAHIRHLDADGPRPILFANGSMLTRSEEHTSELQSLMRTSYDVFCLNTK